MKQPAYTPYDGSARLFTIGLGPLDPSRWIESDNELDRYLREKDRLIAHHRDAVFVEETGTRKAQQEVLDLLLSHLLDQYPARYSRNGTAIAFEGRTVPLASAEALTSHCSHSRRLRTYKATQVSASTGTMPPSRKPSTPSRTNGGRLKASSIAKARNSARATGSDFRMRGRNSARW